MKTLTLNYIFSDNISNFEIHSHSTNTQKYDFFRHVDLDLFFREQSTIKRKTTVTFDS
jgi:hypothetical protein